MLSSVNKKARRVIVAMVGAIVVSGRMFLQAAPDIDRATFTGRVAAGQNVSRTLSNGLLFCLNAEASSGDAGTPAWSVLVGPSCSPSAANFAAVVTPPLHGPNALDIEAWHFGPDVNAPQYVRSFRFVLTKADHDAMFTLLRDPDAGRVLDAMHTRGKGEGTIRVLDFSRRKRATGEWVFDWLTFRADLSWPARVQRR